MEPSRSRQLALIQASLLDGYRLCSSCLRSKWLLNNSSSVCDGERNNKIRVKASTFRDGGKELWKEKREMTSDDFTNPTLHPVPRLNGFQRVELKQIKEAIHRTECTNLSSDIFLGHPWVTVSCDTFYLLLMPANWTCITSKLGLSPYPRERSTIKKMKLYIPGGEWAKS